MAGFFISSCGREVYVAGLGNQQLRKGSVAQGFDSPQLDFRFFVPNGWYKGRK